MGSNVTAVPSTGAEFDDVRCVPFPLLLPLTVHPVPPQLAEWSRACEQPSGVGLVPALPVQLRPPGQVSRRGRSCSGPQRLLSQHFSDFRVFSDGGCFLLVLFCSTHKSPQFYKCGRSGPGPGPGPWLDYRLLTASQCVTLYQVKAAPERGCSQVCVSDLWAVCRWGQWRARPCTVS